jgi:hypothetical protein
MTMFTRAVDDCKQTWDSIFHSMRVPSRDWRMQLATTAANASCPGSEVGRASVAHHSGRAHELSKVHAEAPNGASESPSPKELVHMLRGLDASTLNNTLLTLSHVFRCPLSRSYNDVRAEYGN